MTGALFVYPPTTHPLMAGGARDAIELSPATVCAACRVWIACAETRVPREKDMNKRGWRVAAPLALVAGSLAASQALAAITVDVVSSRPELVTGGDALIRVNGATAAPTVTLDGKDAGA